MKSYQELYASAKKANALKQLTPTYKKWKDSGETIVGAYINQNSVSSRLGGTEYKQYIFETDEGLVKFALGRAADSEFSEMFARGVVYAITYEGKDRISGGRQVNRFSVEEVGVSDAVDDTDQETSNGPDPVVDEMTGEVEAQQAKLKGRGK